MVWRNQTPPFNGQARWWRVDDAGSCPASVSCFFKIIQQINPVLNVLCVPLTLFVASCVSRQKEHRCAGEFERPGLLSVRALSVQVEPVGRVEPGHTARQRYPLREQRQEAGLTTGFTQIIQTNATFPPERDLKQLENNSVMFSDLTKFNLRPEMFVKTNVNMSEPGTDKKTLIFDKIQTVLVISV